MRDSYSSTETRMKLFAIVCLATAVVLASGQSIDECLNQDSISCVQTTIYRKAKEFFGKDTFEIVSGVSLVKAKDGRSSRSSKEVIYDQEINTANNVAERQSVLENFVGDEVGDFFAGRSLKINFAPAIDKIGESARAISESVPQEIRQVVDEVVEGRGKKKMLKQYLPLILLLKAKMGLLAVLGFFAIALIAKKAIVASIISIAIAAFLKIKSYLGGQSGGITGYNNGWNAGASSGWSGQGASPASWSSGSAGWDSGASQSFGGYHR